ncbi:MAG: IMP dehydrogenase, partial [Natronomonas sp.]
LVVDVAHGHLDRTLEAVDELTERFEVPLCAGNVVTAEGVSDLADAGADCIKIGVGPGSHCTTREVTGFGVPQFTAIERCVPAAHDAGVRTIADGGIRRSGDAVKALLAGADAVMVGGLLAGTDSAPADLVERDGNQYKRTRGMATKAAATERGDKTSDVVASEGVEGLTPYTGATEAFLEEFAAGLRSGLSYAGAHDLTTARKRAEFIRITPEAGRRNGAHGVRTDDEP